LETNKCNFYFSSLIAVSALLHLSIKFTVIDIPELHHNDYRDAHTDNKLVNTRSKSFILNTSATINTIITK